MKASLISLLFALVFVAGCSTLETTINGERGVYNCPEGHRVPRVYSGVASDIGFWHTADAGTRILTFIDLPFSAAGDTLLLPYSITMQNKQGDLCPGK